MSSIERIAKQYANHKVENARHELVGVEVSLFENLLELQAREVLTFALPIVREDLAKEVEKSILPELRESPVYGPILSDILETVRGVAGA